MNPPLWPVRCCWLAWKDGQKHGRSLGIGRLAETRVAQLEATAGVSPQVEAYNAVIRTGALQRCMWVEECFWTNFKDVEDEMVSLIQSSFLSPFLEISLLFILLFFPIFSPIDCSNQSHFFVVGLSARSYAEASSLATPWSACWCFVLIPWSIPCSGGWQQLCQPMARQVWHCILRPHASVEVVSGPL